MCEAPSIVALYRRLEADERLERDWEQKQPRTDRCIEAPLIVQTPRELATAAALVVKILHEPGADSIPVPPASAELLQWARDRRHDLCKGGPRLANVIEGSAASPQERAAASK